MTEEEKRQVIRETFHLMVKFHVENRLLKLDYVTRDFVDRWLNIKFQNEDELK